MQFKQHQLDNGLHVIAEVNPSAASMATGFFVRTGSRDETPRIAGVSHFLEHMMFKGSERRTALDVNLEFDEMGALYNAFTSEESTVYFGSVLPEFQPRLVDLLADMMRPSLRTEDFDMEKGVIQEEIALYEDRPMFCLYDNLMTQHFAGHPLGNSILGSVESVAALARDDMNAYFENRYSPTNVTLVAVGDVDFDALCQQASDACGHWTPSETKRETSQCSGAADTKSMIDLDLARQNIGWMSEAPSMQDNDRYPAQVLSMVLGDSSGSRLYYALIETALADGAHTSYSPADRAGALVTYVSTDPDRTEQVIEIVRDEMQKLAADGVTDAELAAAKNKIATSETLKGEVPMGRLTAVGFDWMYNETHEPLSDEIDKLLAVTADDLNTLMRTYPWDEPTILTLGPVGIET